MKISTDIFIMGLCSGWGPCLSFCGPIILPYIAARQTGWVKGLRAAMVFSLSRMVPYVVLALIASGSGQLLIRKYYESKTGIVSSILAGIFIIILGLLLLLGEKPGWRICQTFSQHIPHSDLKGLVGLGLVIGFAPCIPLFGVLAYIALVSKNIFEGLFYGVCFGAGTMLSPLLLFGALAGSLPSALLRKPSLYTFFGRCCGGFLIYLGIKVMAGMVRGLF